MTLFITRSCQHSDAGLTDLRVRDLKAQSGTMRWSAACGRPGGAQRISLTLAKRSRLRFNRGVNSQDIRVSYEAHV